MKSITGKELARIVENHGWYLRAIKGSHHIYRKEGVKGHLSIPIHAGRDIKVGLLSKLMKDAGLTEEDLK